MIVCEIQEYSDLTYRVYDYGRVDAQGKLRELHLEKAMEVTRFDGTRSGKFHLYRCTRPDANKHLLAACEFFATERWDCDRTTPMEGDPCRISIDDYFERATASFTMRSCPIRLWPASLVSSCRVAARVAATRRTNFAATHYCAGQRCLNGQLLRHGI